MLQDQVEGEDFNELHICNHEIGNDIEDYGYAEEDGSVEETEIIRIVVISIIRVILERFHFNLDRFGIDQLKAVLRKRRLDELPN